VKIVAGDMEIQAITVLCGPASYNGVLVDSARVILPGDITEEQIQKMIENSWNVYNDNGDYVYTHSGYNMATEYSVTFIRLPNEAALIFELANTADELSSVKRRGMPL
jgi:hypothetical protein